jgi:hypothetical protein
MPGTSCRPVKSVVRKAPVTSATGSRDAWYTPASSASKATLRRALTFARIRPPGP